MRFITEPITFEQVENTLRRIAESGDFALPTATWDAITTLADDIGRHITAELDMMAEEWAARAGEL